VGYGLSGNAGSLASYPCVLFGVTVKGPLDLGSQHVWLTEKQIRDHLTVDDQRIMVNPRYMTFLLEGSPSRLAQCPLTTDTVISTTETRPTRLRRVARFVRDNERLIAAVLSVLGAAVAAFLTLR
jgi:hypothetical protein